MVKVTFIAKEEGFYKIVFSNTHSWMRPKTLKFRYVVLKPVEPLLTSTAPKRGIGFIRYDKSRKLDVKMVDPTLQNT